MISLQLASGSYFKGFYHYVHVLLNSPILLVLTSQTSDLKSHGLELQVASFGAAKSRHSQPIIDRRVFLSGPLRPSPEESELALLV